MRIQLVLTTFVAGLLLVNAQQIPPVTPECETGRFQFVAGLNDVQCGLGFLAANNTPTGTAGLAALDTICTANCAGAVSNYVLGPPCNSPLQSGALRFWCLPVENANITRCRFALDLIDPTIFNNTDVISCLWAMPEAMPPSCPSTCAAGLSRIAQGIGCCFQSIWNNTMYIQALNFGQEELAFYTTLQDPDVWKACNVSIPGQCADPFMVSQTTMSTSGGVLIGATITAIIISVLFSLYYM